MLRWDCLSRCWHGSGAERSRRDTLERNVVKSGVFSMVRLHENNTPVLPEVMVTSVMGVIRRITSQLVSWHVSIIKVIPMKRAHLGTFANSIKCGRGACGRCRTLRRTTSQQL
jgi:hypothetical protein